MRIPAYPAQEIQRKRHGYMALEMTGAQRFDFGVPDGYVASVQAFGNRREFVVIIYLRQPQALLKSEL